VTQVKHTQRCDVCGSSVQFGPGIYDGKYVAAYLIFACSACLRGNWDGWAPQFEAAVTRHLIEKALPIPARNAKGWLPVEG
jgi:hypothetical protein